MTASFEGRVPTLWHGRGIAREVIAHLVDGRDALVIADPALVVPVRVRRPADTIEIDARSVGVAHVVALARQIARRRPEVIVAVGGGSILDASKLAALVLAPGRLFEFAVERASRAALTFLPDARPPVDLVAVPTTIGTSSETNSVAILRNGSGSRLVVGRSLRPRHAVIDGHNLLTLTPAAIREGALEAFLRLAGASTSARRSVRARRDAVALGQALLDTATRDGASTASRLRLARLSAATQRSGALRGQDPYSARHWYVANEVAVVLGVRKMVATAAVITAVWRRICAGDARWGDRRSLEDFWTSVVDGSGLPLHPPAGIDMLLDLGRIPRPPRPTSDEMLRIGADTERWWGGRYPMLPGLLAADFVDLLRGSRWSTQPVGRTSRLSSIDAEEVNR
ncbi:daptide-type RiPP biosynthesis dehydogenase [Microbacterium sp. H83]|uniref:daptide-type RiPP biosynthesis dehydogenase n=1 Tax=Microbacterium sp. H83 TaxID=1827324 RepID=UPI0007F4E3A8|nr:daptide-type RiPP biosynthesis dehydogenase [Microbacterium sp. H83]OAN36609.1 hypothetical protein A4X16_04185 [Microbacterium sp. H83]